MPAADTSSLRYNRPRLSSCTSNCLPTSRSTPSSRNPRCCWIPPSLCSTVRYGEAFDPCRSSRITTHFGRSRTGFVIKPFEFRHFRLNSPSSLQAAWNSPRTRLGRHALLHLRLDRNPQRSSRTTFQSYSLLPLDEGKIRAQ